MKCRTTKYRTTGAAIALSIMGAGAVLPTHYAHAQDTKTAASVMDTVKATRSGGLYAPERAPLQPAPFQKLPPGAVRAGGWLKIQLDNEAEGLTGRMTETSHFLDIHNTGWTDPAKGGFEEVGYWLRGFVDLAFVTGNKRLIGISKQWVDGILATQVGDGYFGPTALRTSVDGGADLWPHMPILDALRSYQEATNDPRIIPFMTRYFAYQQTVPAAQFNKSWGAVRWGDNLDSLVWLYNRTGEASLLALAKHIHQHSADYVGGIPSVHNVNFAQGFREPAQFGQVSGDPALYGASVRDYDKMMATWGQMPGGGFAGDETARKGYEDPRQGFETCGIVEYMRSFEILDRIAGNTVWADKNEELAFNNLPAALTADGKLTHYITSVNQIELSSKGQQHKQFDDSPARLQPYELGIDEYRCCPHNVGMGWPYYVENAWLATYDKGLCAALYAESEVKAKVGDGTEVSFAERTDYPFADMVNLTLTSPRAVSFPLYLRVPAWCQQASVQINDKAVDVKPMPSSYVMVSRQWQPGDRVTLHLPMRVAVKTWPAQKNAVSVSYGPLDYSLRLNERFERAGGTEAWPEYAVRTNSPWNYGLLLNTKDAERQFKIVHKPYNRALNPFTPQNVPIALTVQAKPVPNWRADADGVVGLLQNSPAATDRPAETVTLIPMGAARLRIASFPTVTANGTGTAWTVPTGPLTAASHTNDNLDALNDPTEPASSGSQNTPRFTWWDHKGTIEWVSYQFPTPRIVSGVSVYWFDDTGVGQCRVPRSWTLEYKDGDMWKSVQGAANYGAERDKYNTLTFAPVKTTAMRLNAHLQDGYSGGVLRWRVQ